MEPPAGWALRDDPRGPQSGAEGFRPFEHTGDLGLEVWADSPARLYALAAEALSAQIAVAEAGPADLEIEVRLEGEGPQDLLIHWLNTVLLEGELRRAVWTRAEVTRLAPGRLEATLAGQTLDRGRQTFLREVKAVSMHGLVLDLAATPCRCRLILDL